MAARPRLTAGVTLALIAIAAAAAMALVPASLADRTYLDYEVLTIAALVIGAAILVWHVDPAYTLSAAIFLTPFAGNWPEMGIPGPASPDRLLFVGGLAAVILRAPAVADRPRLRFRASHWVLLAGIAYVIASAAAAGTLGQKASALRIIDAYGVIPFLTFVAAPVAFATPRQRRILLGALVALGVYLGLTVFFETAHADALVWPKYIVDPRYGIHLGRGRGPFVDAVANGLALYTCAVASAIAVYTWSTTRWRVFAALVGTMCLVGSFLSLERSVWIGAGVGTVVAMLATRGLRRYLIPVATVALIAGTAAVAFIPGLSTSVSQRANEQGPIWDRQNLTTAGLNMVEARPLFGFGWSRFTQASQDYFKQAKDYPLTATKADLHNTPLTYAAELGLVGLALWALGLLLGVGGTLATRGPPDLKPWRIGLLAIAGAFVVVVNSVPPTEWPTRSLWLFAAVAASGGYAARGRARRADRVA